MAVYLTGDTHGTFDRIMDFVEEYELTEEDTIIILGDAGFNYFLDERDAYGKLRVAQLPATIFCIHGNHEERPENLPNYEELEWHGGVVLYEPEYPNILFARDGDIYDFDGKKAIVIGGAYSVDKYYRLTNGGKWFDSEQPDDQTKARVEAALDRVGWRVDYVLTHTAPLEFVPRDTFLPGLDQSTVDNSTERWLGEIERKLDYSVWYAGHYHVTRIIDKLHFLFEDYEELGGPFYAEG